MRGGLAGGRHGADDGSGHGAWRGLQLGRLLPDGLAIRHVVPVFASIRQRLLQPVLQQEENVGHQKDAVHRQDDTDRTVDIYVKLVNCYRH